MGYLVSRLARLIVLFLGTIVMTYSLEEVLRYSISIDRETGTKVCTVCRRRLYYTDFYIRRSGQCDPLTGERRIKIDSKCIDCCKDVNKSRWTNRRSKVDEPKLVPVDLELAMSFPLQKEWKGSGNGGASSLGAVAAYL